MNIFRFLRKLKMKVRITFIHAKTDAIINLLIAGINIIIGFTQRMTVTERKKWPEFNGSGRTGTDQSIFYDSSSIFVREKHLFGKNNTSNSIGQSWNWFIGKILEIFVTFRLIGFTFVFSYSKIKFCIVLNQGFIKCRK